MPTSCGGQCWFLFPVAIVLLAGGCAALVLLGLPAVQQYSASRHFRSSECRLVALQHAGNRSCRSGSVSTTLPTSYPCVLIIVQYDSDDHGFPDYNSNNSYLQSANMAVLYDNVLDVDATRTTADGFIQNSTCSKHACGQSSTTENTLDVQQFIYGSNSRTYSSPDTLDGAEVTLVPISVRRCYVDLTGWDSNYEYPVLGLSDHTSVRLRRAYVDVVSGDRVVHTLWWPSLAIGAGIFLLVVAVCQLCYEARPCRRMCRRGSCRRKHRYPTVTDLPEVVGGAKSSVAGVSGSSSICSTCERATLTTGTSSSSSGTNSSRRSKSIRSSASNKSLLPMSATSTSRSSKSTAETPTDKYCHCNVDEQKHYASNTV